MYENKEERLNLTCCCIKLVMSLSLLFHAVNVCGSQTIEGSLYGIKLNQSSAFLVMGR